MWVDQENVVSDHNNSEMVKSGHSSQNQIINIQQDLNRPYPVAVEHMKSMTDHLKAQEQHMEEITPMKISHKIIKNRHTSSDRVVTEQP